MLRSHPRASLGDDPADAGAPSVAPLSFEAAAAVLRSQPFSLHVGAVLTEFARASATVEVEIRELHRQQFGLVHGGVWAFAADNAITFAAGSVLGESVVTSGLTIEYLRPARVGRIRAQGRVMDASGGHAVCSARLTHVSGDGSEHVCAIALGRVSRTRTLGGEAAPEGGDRA